MTPSRALLLATAALLGACGALSRTTALKDPLPPAAGRVSLGAWQLGDDNCVGSIQSAGSGYFWVVDCQVKAGYGWCDYGLELSRVGPDDYANAARNWSFAVNPDGSLSEARDGETVGRYPPSPIGACGARRGSRP